MVFLRAAKAALNQIIKSFSIELSRTHPKACLLAIHPGTVDTSLTHKYASNHPTQTPAEAAQNILDVTLNKDSSHTGRFFDWANKEIPW
jgi:NAD(P)-dependent dehydrogenase (short-subunit alcohol dehydrogenase family)